MNQMTNNIAEVLVANLAARQDWDEPPQLYWLNLTKGHVDLGLFPARGGRPDVPPPTSLN